MSEDLLEGYIPTQLEMHRMAPAEDHETDELVKRFIEVFKDRRFDIIWQYTDLAMEQNKKIARVLRKRGWRVHPSWQYKSISMGPRLLVFPRGFWGGVRYHLFRWFI